MKSAPHVGVVTIKEVSYQQLIAAIRAVASGATVFQPAVTERLLRAGTRARVDAEPPREPLTEREAQWCA